jgi:hypothetical protein
MSPKIDQITVGSIGEKPGFRPFDRDLLVSILHLFRVAGAVPTQQILMVSNVDA